MDSRFQFLDAKVQSFSLDSQIQSFSVDIKDDAMSPANLEHWKKIFSTFRSSDPRAEAAYTYSDARLTECKFRAFGDYVVSLFKEPASLYSSPNDDVSCDEDCLDSNMPKKDIVNMTTIFLFYALGVGAGALSSGPIGALIGFVAVAATLGIGGVVCLIAKSIFTKMHEQYLHKVDVAWENFTKLNSSEHEQNTDTTTTSFNSEQDYKVV